MKYLLGFLVFLASSFLSLRIPVSATAQRSPEHLTTIIVQVRGTECCNPGNVQALERWLHTSAELDIPLTLALRYDALKDETFKQAFTVAKEQHELAGYLEITPALTQKSGVEYTGTTDSWHSAHQAFLVGYTQTDRQKIIDAYMQAFREETGSYPTTTVAWMIDTFSLRYLAETYGVTVHEITREQLGVDSYTLHGGPAHYPYYPSENWALIPAAPELESHMPLIIRQTVTDPVWNYGDTTSSYTSQPNDYDLARRGLEYFRFLFTQAHSQPEPVTFALLGLENSMPEKDQLEFARQLEIVAQWETENDNNRTLLARELPQHWDTRDKLQVYAGTDKTDKEEGKNSQAWWIGTPSYRIRVRYENGTLFISDIRIYDARWKDPYWNTAATGGAYWIVPFLLDGSRFLEDGSAEPVNWNDTLTYRKGRALPTRIVIAENLSPEQLRFEYQDNSARLGTEKEILIQFEPRTFSFLNQATFLLSHSQLKPIITNLQWKNSSGEVLWELSPSEEKSSTGFSNNSLLSNAKHPVSSNLLRFTPLSHTSDLTQERVEKYYLLHPEIITRPIDIDNSYLRVMNRYSMISRNPVRIAFWPRDQHSYPSLLDTEPRVHVDHADTKVNIALQQLPQGYVFIDFDRNEPGSVTASFEYNGFTQTETFYFVPNCRQKILACLTRPIDIWRFIQLKLEEREMLREQE